jgi:putative MFS transporter
MLMTLGSPFGSLAGMYVGERFNRKPSLVGLSVAAAVLGLAYPIFINPVAFITIGWALVFTVAMMNALAWSLYVPELFPTELRMRGAGVCNTAGRLMSLVSPYIVVQLWTSFGTAGVVAVMASLLLLQAVVIAVLGIETRKRPLEDLRPAAMNAAEALDADTLQPALPQDRS